MKELKVYKQWLADENNNIAHKTLTEWAEYFGLKMAEGSTWMWLTREYIEWSYGKNEVA